MTTTQALSTPHSPPLSLPIVLKLQILSYFENEFQPTLMLLRRTHSTFRPIISAQVCIGANQRIKARRMLAAEHVYPFLFAPNHYPCYGRCLAVLKALNLIDIHLRSSDYRLCGWDSGPKNGRWVQSVRLNANATIVRFWTREAGIGSKRRCFHRGNRC